MKQERFDKTVFLKQHRCHLYTVHWTLVVLLVTDGNGKTGGIGGIARGEIFNFTTAQQSPNGKSVAGVILLENLRFTSIWVNLTLTSFICSYHFVYRFLLTSITIAQL